MTLSMVSIHKSFGRQEVLRGVSLELRPREVVALIGRNGSGKSTLMRIAAGILSPDRGEVSLRTQSSASAAAVKVNEAWPSVTAVFQDIFLWPHLSALRNVSLPLERGHGVKAEELALTALASLGIEDLRSKRASVLSRGEAQLVALARAFALSPSYLLLDEATASLDLEKADLVARQLRRRTQEGLGVLLVTHQVGLAATAANSIYFLDGGELVETGDASILMQPKSAGFAKFLTLSRELR